MKDEDEPVEELKKGRGRKKEAKPKQYNDTHGNPQGGRLVQLNDTNPRVHHKAESRR